jgi:hypothetical protein
MQAFGITVGALVAGYLVAIAFWGPQGFQMPTANEVDAMTGQPIGPPVEAGVAVPEKLTRAPRRP